MTTTRGAGTSSGEPSSSPDLRGLLLDYLDHYRDVVAEKFLGLEAAEAVTSHLPSGWTPAGLLGHLAAMERRWFQWGFLAEDVDDPWPDRAAEGWVTPTTGQADLVRQLRQQGERTRKIVAAHPLDELARTGGRFPASGQPPQLHWILLHVLQEYARHAGHLDIVRELADGQVGEGGLDPRLVGPGREV